MKKVNGVLLSFMIGGAVGSAIALLYAPKSGKSLRNDLGRKTNELIDDGKKLTYDTWTGAKNFTESTLENANDLLNTGVEKITNGTEKVKKAFKSGIDSFNNEGSSEKNKGGLYDKDSEKIHSRIT